MQHTATLCNTLQHTATHCNTLQHTATHVYKGVLRGLHDRAAAAARDNGEALPHGTYVYVDALMYRGRERERLYREKERFSGCGMLQCVAVCCSVMQCVALCCSL